MITECDHLFFKTVFSRFTKQFRMLSSEKSDFLNFSSLDTLNLMREEYLRSTAVDFMIKWGVGHLPSRPADSLIQMKRDVEKYFASMTAFDSATLLEIPKISPSQLISQIITPKTLILKQAGFSYNPLGPALIKSFETTDDSTFLHLVRSIDPSQYDKIIILVESICSLTGKKVDLRKLCMLAKELKAFLIADDTNSFGSFGHNGMGIAATMGGIDLVFGSFCKTFGSYASYFLSSKPVKDHILTTSPLAAAATSLSPFLLGFIKASIDLLPTMSHRREYLLRQAKSFREIFVKTGVTLSQSDTHIISLNFDNDLEQRHFNFHLSENQCMSNIHRTSDDIHQKITSRFIINTDHSPTQLMKLTHILKNLRTTPYCEAL